MSGLLCWVTGAGLTPRRQARQQDSFSDLLKKACVEISSQAGRQAGRYTGKQTGRQVAKKNGPDNRNNKE